MLTQKKISETYEVPPQINLNNDRERYDLSDAFKVLNKWNCSDEEIRNLLGFNNEDEFLEMISNPTRYPFKKGQIKRMRYLINIEYALNILLSKSSADSWVYRPNLAPLFKGKSAIQIMQSGRLSDLKAVSEYLFGNIFL